MSWSLWPQHKEPQAEAAKYWAILLRDGRLFGFFNSRESAKYWAAALELDAYETYDLHAPGELK